MRPETDARSFKGLARYPLLRALIERRSRRFGAEMSLNGSPPTYEKYLAHRRNDREAR